MRFSGAAMRGVSAFLLRCAAATFCALPAATNASTVNVTQSFDFSANPVTLTPFDPSIPQTLTAGQYITLAVNFGQQFTSFSDLKLSWTAINPPNGGVGVRWGNYSLAGGWPPPNVNNGSVYAAQGGFNPSTTSSISIDYVDSSTQLINLGFGAAVDNINSGQFFISLSLCSPYCESSPGGWYGPVTFSSFSVPCPQLGQ
jgi:hypothetical protein